MQQIAELLRLFSASRATLAVLVAQKVLTSALVKLVSATQAFLQVHIKVPKCAVSDHSLSGHLYELFVLRESRVTDELQICTITTLDRLAPTLRTAQWSERRLISIKFPLRAQGSCLCQIVVAAISHCAVNLELLPGTQDANTFAAITSFQQVRSVSMVTVGNASQHAARFWQFVRSANLPKTIVQLDLLFTSTRPPLAELLQLLQVPEWVPAVRHFRWIFRSEAGMRAATTSEMLLLEDGVSYQAAFADALAKRDAKLGMGDGKRYVRVV